MIETHNNNNNNINGISLTLSVPVNAQNQRVVLIDTARHNIVFFQSRIRKGIGFCRRFCFDQRVEAFGQFLWAAVLNVGSDERDKRKRPRRLEEKQNSIFGGYS